MPQKPISEMTTKEFRAFAKTLSPDQAEAARRERHLFTQARWREANPERLRETGRKRWSVWVANLSEAEREAYRARDRERKRRERAKR
jgi:hypothetical protein